MTAYAPRSAAAACAVVLGAVLTGCTSHGSSGSPTASPSGTSPAGSDSPSPPTTQSTATDSTAQLPIPSASTPTASGSGVLAVRVQGTGTRQWPLRGISCTPTGFTSHGTVLVTSTPTSLTIRNGTPVDGLTVAGTTRRSGSARLFSGQADTVTVQVRTQC